MSKDFELLPLPFAPVDDGTKQWFAEDMRAYALANIAAALSAQALPVPDGMMLVPIDPPFPKKWIAKGVRTVNENQSVVWLGYTDEGGGWHQWCTHKNSAKLFDTEEAAMRNAKSCAGPRYNEPGKSSITAEQVEGPQAHKYRAALAAVKEKGRG